MACPDSSLRFTYHHAVAPMMWVLVGLSSIELVVVHLMISLLLGRGPALLLSIVTVAGMGWLVSVIVSMRRLPVILDSSTLTMRAGILKCRTVPLDRISGVRRDWDAATVKAKTTLNLALIAYPNVLIDLSEPLPGRRGIKTIAHRFDDPAGFVTALERLRARE